MKLIRLMALGFLLAGLAGCTSTQNGQALMGPPDTSPVIFSYDGQDYTADDFGRYLDDQIGERIAEFLAQGQTRQDIESLAAEADVRSQVFEQMLQEALLSRYARQNGIGANASAVDEIVLQSISPAEDSPFLITTSERVTTAANQQRLEVMARNTRADMVRANQIIVADQAAADALVAELNAGADFAALARERSLDGGSREKGGVLGWVPAGNNPTEWDDAAFAAQPPAIVTATSQLGVHVIQVLERAEKRPFDSFEALRNSANGQQFYEQTFVPWYEELRREAEKSGELRIAPNFDPNTTPLPFPEGTP